MYMIITILIITIALVCIYYFYIKKVNPIIESNKNIGNVDVDVDFLASDSFIGEKKGYVYKNDSKGLGYYIDNKYY